MLKEKDLNTEIQVGSHLPTDPLELLSIAKNTTTTPVLNKPTQVVSTHSDQELSQFRATEINVGSRLPISPLESLTTPKSTTDISIPIGTTVDEALKELFIATLEQQNGNILKTGKVLDIPLKTAYNWSNKWKLRS